jgi:hypothetical protein
MKILGRALLESGHNSAESSRSKVIVGSILPEQPLKALYINGSEALQTVFKQDL